MNQDIGKRLKRSMNSLFSSSIATNLFLEESSWRVHKNLDTVRFQRKEENVGNGS